MAEATDLTVEILKQIRAELRDGLAGVRDEIRQTNARLDGTNARLEQTSARLDGTNARLDETNRRLDQTNSRLENIREMQELLVTEHRKTNQRLDFFAEELVRMRTRDNERLSALETAVAELKHKVG